MNLLSETFLAFLIGVDEVKITDGKATLKFLLTSKRYSCMKVAVSVLQEFNSCKACEKNIWIDDIQKSYDYFNGVLERAKNEFHFGLEYVYDVENQKVIDEMKDALIQKGKFL